MRYRNQNTLQPQPWLTSPSPCTPVSNGTGCSSWAQLRAFICILCSLQHCSTLIFFSQILHRTAESIWAEPVPHVPPNTHGHISHLQMWLQGHPQFRNTVMSESLTHLPSPRVPPHDNQLQTSVPAPGNPLLGGARQLTHQTQSSFERAASSNRAATAPVKPRAVLLRNTSASIAWFSSPKHAGHWNSSR